MPIFNYKSEKIFYDTYGSGPLLILHHGFGSNRFSWIKYDWINSLVNEFKILIFDAIGHGKSSKPGNINHYTIESRTKIAWLPPQPFLNFGIKARLLYERIRARSEI